jgi:hypothetical protein
MLKAIPNIVEFSKAPLQIVVERSNRKSNTAILLSNDLPNIRQQSIRLLTEDPPWQHID